MQAETEARTFTPEALASKGFYLFPCKGKKPLVKWKDESTTNLDKIKEWSRRYPKCSWGVDCGKSGFIVLDDDRGKNEKAKASFEALEIEYGVFSDTFTVRTPSGGYHFYFRGHGKNSASTKLGVGLDSRGDGGYVLAPCSGGYRVDKNTAPQDAPGWLLNLLGKPEERQEAPVPENVELDTTNAIFRATNYLQNVEPACMGAGGNEHIYRVAARVKDFGISYDTAIELMFDHWYPRCEPNNRYASVERITKNAYQYGVLPAGSDSPEVVFTLVETPEAQIPATKKSMFIDANELISRPMTINYLVENLIETPATGLMFGESTAGKSFLAIDLAYSVATGTPWLTRPSQQGPVFYLAGEGQNGFPRRLAAWTKHHGIRSTDGMLNITRSRIELTAESAKIMRAEIDALAATHGRPKLIIVDTLARHIPADADENSAKDIGSFFNVIDDLKNCYRCVVLVIHHSGKMSKDSSRGSSAIKAAMDFEIMIKKGVVQYTKQKDGDLPEPIGFSLVDVVLQEDPFAKSAVPVVSDYDPSHGKAANLSSDAQLALAVLQFEISQGGKDWVYQEIWSKSYREKLDDKLSKAAKRQNFTRVKKSLLDSVTIRCDGERVFDNTLTVVDTEENGEDE